MVPQVSSTANGSWFSVLPVNVKDRLIQKIALAVISSTGFVICSRTLLDIPVTTGILMTTMVSAGLFYDFLAARKIKPEPSTDDLIRLADVAKSYMTDYMQHLLDLLKDANEKGLSAVTLTRYDWSTIVTRADVVSVASCKEDFVARLKGAIYSDYIACAKKLGVLTSQWEEENTRLRLEHAAALRVKNPEAKQCADRLSGQMIAHKKLLIHRIKTHIFQKYGVVL